MYCVLVTSIIKMVFMSILNAPKHWVSSYDFLKTLVNQNTFIFRRWCHATQDFVEYDLLANSMYCFNNVLKSAEGGCALCVSENCNTTQWFVPRKVQHQRYLNGKIFVNIHCHCMIIRLSNLVSLQKKNLSQDQGLWTNAEK